MKQESHDFSRGRFKKYDYRDNNVETIIATILNKEREHRTDLEKLLKKF